MALELVKGKSSSKTILNDRLTIVYAEMVPSDKVLPANSTTESSDSNEDSSQSTSGSSSGPTESMKRLLEKLEDDKDREYHFGYEPVWRTMSTTDGTKMKSLDYYRSHNIFQLFTFFISHLLAHTPEEPIDFLVSLVDRCIAYRDRGADPPLLFEDKHVLSVYTALDPLDGGVISYNKYTAGMATLGLTTFNLLPEDMDESNVEVSKETFLREAKHGLLDQLDKLLGHSQPMMVSGDITLKESEVKNLMYGSRSEEIMNDLYDSHGSSRFDDKLSVNTGLSSDPPKKRKIPRAMGSITPSIASTVSLKSMNL